MENPVKTSTKKIMAGAKLVHLNPEAVKTLAEKWAMAKIAAPAWDNEKHFLSQNSKSLLTYLIILDSLNFCFWGEDPEVRWSVNFKGKKISGYFAWSLSLKKFFEAHPDKNSFEYFAKMPFAEFQEMLEGGEHLLLLDKRYEILQSVSQTFIKKYRGDPLEIVSESRLSAAKFVRKIVTEIPSFRDEVITNNTKIYFWKRAQILAGDIYGSFQGRGSGNFRDIEWLSAFPDYKLPQILYTLSVLSYDPLLEKRIRDFNIIESGSQEEIEIRSATVTAVEMLKTELCALNCNKLSFEIDWLLWNESQSVPLKIPHHRTLTWYY